MIDPPVVVNHPATKFTFSIISVGNYDKIKFENIPTNTYKITIKFNNDIYPMSNHYPNGPTFTTISFWDLSRVNEVFEIAYNINGKILEKISKQI